MKLSDEALLYILTLEEEVEALRSVLSEYGSNHDEYLQYIKADAMREVRNHIRRPI